MAEPGKYPETDGAEQRAIENFTSKLDADEVKYDLKSRDKHPNTDGTIELVANNLPRGKFDVQIKTLPAGASHFNCPVSLGGYSAVSSLPLLLIASDPSTGRVFWKHVFEGMPEFRDNKCTFVIHFSDVDRVDESKVYLERWKNIASDYNNRVADYPRLSERISNELELEEVSPEMLEYFQRYVTELNFLLKGDFAFLKNRVIPSDAQMGIAIAREENHEVEYHYHRLHFGDKQPMVIKVPHMAWGDVFKGPKVTRCSITSKSFLRDPKYRALLFIEPFVEDALNSNSFGFSIDGVDVSSNLVHQFVSAYPRCFEGVVGDSINIPDVEDALYKKLPETIRRIFPFPFHDSLYEIGLNALEECIEFHKKEGRIPDVVRNGSFLPIRSLEEAISCLKERGINEVIDPWRKAYSEEDNFHFILEKIIKNYTVFVKANGLVFPDSPYLRADVCVIFSSSIVVMHGQKVTKLDEYYVANDEFLLPKFMVLDECRASRILGDTKYPAEIKYDGGKFPLLGAIKRMLPFSNKLYPHLNLVRIMLKEDLVKRYGFKNIH